MEPVRWWRDIRPFSKSNSMPLFSPEVGLLSAVLGAVLGAEQRIGLA